MNLRWCALGLVCLVMECIVLIYCPDRFIINFPSSCARGVLRDMYASSGCTLQIYCCDRFVMFFSCA